MLQQNRWHPVMLPDDYLRKMRQDLAESDAADSASLSEPDLDDPHRLTTTRRLDFPACET
jgi:hypothetical protein